MGYGIFVGWAEESGNWGDAAAARTQFARPYEETQPDHEIPRNAVAYLGDRSPSNVFDGIEKGSFPIVVPLVYDGVGKLLKHCQGIVADAGAGPYTHTHDRDDKPYTRAASPLIGLSLEAFLDLPDSGFESLIGNGGRVRSFGSNMRAGEEVRLNVDCVCQKVILGAKTASPTFPDYDADRVIPANIVIDIDTVEEEIYGIDWSVDNGLRDDKGVLGSQYIGEPRARGRATLTGTIEKEWLSKAHYDKFISGAVASVLVTCTGAGNNVMTFDFAEIVYTGKTPAPQEGEEQDQSLPFMALKHATKDILQIVETNDTATT